MDGFFLSWRDMLDVALVTALVYRILLLIRGTRALSALFGLLLLLVAYLVAQYLALYTLTWLLENLFGSLFLVLVILFHDDIRQLLAAVGARSLWRSKRKLAAPILDDLMWVCEYCARRRTGVLIVLEKRMELGDLLKGGVDIDARFSRELLLTIFYHGTALHDGAVLIRKNRVVSAGCILPLATMERQSFGTRHRAALGLTEASDAVVLVVSEERGEISVAVRGHLAVMQNREQFKETLQNATLQ